MNVLLLGGTSEARRLAARLADVPDLRVVTSLAGRVRTHRELTGEVRSGGFGGVAGLSAWVREHTPSLVVDATHPFAQQISRHIVASLAGSPTPLLRLARPGWVAGSGDRWFRVSDLPSAAALTPTLGRRPLVTTGRQGLALLMRHPALVGLPLVVRCVEPPSETLPPNVRLVRDRGPYTVGEERALLRGQRIDVLVTKDSGGDATRAKLDASRELGLPVVMVNRPPAPALGVLSAETTAAVSDVGQAEAWVRARVLEARHGAEGQRRPVRHDV